jgi:hypothetical protein
VQRIKKCAHLKRRRLQKKPLLTQRHKENRLNFARNHMDWNDQWNTVIFTDKKRFCLDGPDGYLYCEKKKDLWLAIIAPWTSKVNCQNIFF